MKYTLFLACLPALLLVSCRTHSPGELTMSETHWKKQALQDILPFWSSHARDTINGAFLTNLDGEWNPLDNSAKYPSMLSRHLFSYSAAYLLSGEDAFLATAEEIKDYLLKHAWDEQYGGWYDTVTRKGSPGQTSKSMFVQVYAITGLVMYYFVTHDPEVLGYIDRSNTLLETKAWDPETGGYFNAFTREWAVLDDRKSFSAVLTPVSGYLLYLYLATRDGKYLKQAERITDVVMNRMVDPETGWILESFDRNWNYLPGPNDETEVNVGHNLEGAWMLARLYLLNEREDYFQKARVLSDRLHQYGFSPSGGIWFASMGNHEPERHSAFTYWWIQAYGNMLDLSLYRLYRQPAYLASFENGSRFWDAYFLDREMGDTYFSVFQDGKPKERTKANPYKTSYHSMEHAMLNYLYLALWVNQGPVSLYFRIHSSSEGELLYPVPVEEPAVGISQVLIDGKKHTAALKGRQALVLPALKKSKLMIRLRAR